jgi:hypothetical protein
MLATAGSIGFEAVSCIAADWAGSVVGSMGSVGVGAVFVGAVVSISVGVAAVGSLRVGVRDARWTDSEGNLPLLNLYPRN